MKEIYRLHEKATALLELCKQEEERINLFKSGVIVFETNGFNNPLIKAIHNKDISERALKRLKYSYMKVLMQIAEL
jgi:hypothetical protein